MSAGTQDNLVAALPQPPKLLDQLRAALRVRHCSRRTEEAYAQNRRDEFVITAGGDNLKTVSRS